MKEWNRLEPGFESGKMADFLRQHEPNFKEIRSKMPTFFENIRAVQKKTNKYVHKQGYSSFYTTQSYSFSDHREDKVYLQIVSDFEETLNVAIGAVAMYRLAIRPFTRYINGRRVDDAFRRFCNKTIFRRFCKQIHWH